MTSPSSGAAPAATPPRSAPHSSARRSPASSRSRSSAARACASAASRRRPGCRPRSRCKEAEESFAKFGVQVGEATLDFAAANAWKAGVVKQMTEGVAVLFKANGVEWVKGTGRFKDANTIAVEGGEDVTLQAGGHRHRLVPAAAADRRARLAALRRLDRPARADRGAEAGSSSSAAGSSAASSRRSSAASAPR